MTEFVEKNDVQINRLFHWGKKYEVIWEDEEKKTLEVWVRLLGDADVNRARVYALRKSAELRRKLHDPDSDERLAFLFNPESLETERLIALIAGLSLREITQNTIKSLKVKVPKQPKSDAPLEELENYQKEVDEYAPKREAEIKKNVEKEVTKLSKELTKLTREELIVKYESSMIDEVCEQEVINSFKEMSAYLGAFQDENYTVPLFDNFEQFHNLPTDIKNQFINNHQMLELTSSDLKKLQQATQ